MTYNSRTNKPLHYSSHKMLVNELLMYNSNGHWKSMTKKDLLVTFYENGFVCDVCAD